MVLFLVLRYHLMEIEGKYLVHIYHFNLRGLQETIPCDKLPPIRLSLVQ